MISFPLRNLGAGEQWGRTVQDELQALDRDITQLRNSQALTDSTQNTQLASLIYKQQQLQAQQDSIVAAQDSIVTAQATLEQQQIDLQWALENLTKQQVRQDEALWVESRNQSYTVTGSTGFTEYSSSVEPPAWASRALVTIYQPSLSITRSPNTPSKVVGWTKVSGSPITDFASPLESAGWRVSWEDELVSRTSNTTPPVTTLERLRTFNVSAFSLDNLTSGVVYFGHSVVRSTTLVTPTITGQQVYRFDWY